jgi:hypothetical protein
MFHSILIILKLYVLLNSPSLPSQEHRVCPACGIRDTNTEALRCHIEVEHGDLLQAAGREGVTRMIFWRSKRGVRHLSRSVILRVLKKENIPTGRRRMKTLRAIGQILKLCLVEIADDCADPNLHVLPSLFLHRIDDGNWIKSSSFIQYILYYSKLPVFFM